MCEPFAFLGWSFEFVTGKGESVTLTRDDVEQLLFSLMHHRLLRVDVAFPEGCTEALAAATFGTGNSIALTYDEDDVITLDIEASDLVSSLPLAAAKTNAASKKKGGAK